MLPEIGTLRIQERNQFPFPSFPNFIVIGSSTRCSVRKLQLGFWQPYLRSLWRHQPSQPVQPAATPVLAQPAALAGVLQQAPLQAALEAKEQAPLMAPLIRKVDQVHLTQRGPATQPLALPPSSFHLFRRTRRGRGLVRVRGKLRRQFLIACWSGFLRRRSGSNDGV